MIRIEVCGSLRRRAETIGDLDILISSENVPAVLDAFVKLPQVATVLAHGPTKASVRLADGVQCDLRGVDGRAVSVCAALLHRLEGAQHRDAEAGDRPRALAERVCAFRARRATFACKTEADVFKALGLVEIPPELREDSGEIEAAEAGKLPDLIEFGDLTGTFHCHTDWSDGAATLAEMAQAARDRGMAVPGNRRSFAIGGVCRGAFDRAGARAMGGDRRAQSVVRREVSPVQGDRVRHSAGRLARLSGRAARRVRLRGGEHPLEFRAVARRDDAAAGAGGLEPAGDDAGAPDRAAVCWRATGTTSISTR